MLQRKWLFGCICRKHLKNLFYDFANFPKQEITFAEKKYNIGQKQLVTYDKIILLLKINIIVKSEIIVTIKKKYRGAAHPICILKISISVLKISLNTGKNCPNISEQSLFISWWTLWKVYRFFQLEKIL